MFSQVSEAPCFNCSHFSPTPVQKSETPVLTCSQIPPQNSGTPAKKSCTACHFSEIQPVKSDHICLPVSVCVKNHVRPATAADTAATPRPIGCAAISPVNPVQPLESVPVSMLPRPPALVTMLEKPVPILLRKPVSPMSFLAPPQSSPAVLKAFPTPPAASIVLPTAVVTPPKATAPRARLLTSVCCSGVRFLYQPVTASSAGASVLRRLVPISVTAVLTGKAASPSSCMLWFISFCASREARRSLFVSWYCCPASPRSPLSVSVMSVDRSCWSLHDARAALNASSFV